MKLLRLERLAPAVLLALFDGVPQIVHIEEPRQGIQFGIRLDATDDLETFEPWIPPRDRHDPQKAINVKVTGAVPAAARPACSTSRHLNRGADLTSTTRT